MNTENSAHTAASPTGGGVRSRSWGKIAFWLALIYAALVVIWYLMHLTIDSGFAPLYFLNTIAVYLFPPVLLLIAVAAALRSRILWAAGALVIIVFLFAYGELLIPGSGVEETYDPDNLIRIMTFNVLYENENFAETVSAFQKSDAGLIGVQEMTFEMADALESSLGDVYPYMELTPREHQGLGLLSKYPLEPYNSRISERYNWLGVPQTVELILPGDRRVLVINYHVVAPAAPGLAGIVEHAQQRDDQARALAEAATDYPGPVVAFGDLNATEFNSAHQIMRTALEDTWREGGWLFGHTFPAGFLQQGSNGMPLPPWLVRIDHIFASEEWQTLEARVGPWGGYSDHRPTQATLRLLDTGGVP